MSPPQMFLMNLSHDFSKIPVWFPLMDVSAAVNERNLKPSTLLDKIYDNIAGQKVFFKEKSCQVLMNERGFSQADQKKTNDGVF